MLGSVILIGGRTRREGKNCTGVVGTNLGIVFPSNGGFGEEFGPLVRETGEGASDGVEPDVNLVNKVGRI